MSRSLQVIAAAALLAAMAGSVVLLWPRPPRPPHRVAAGVYLGEQAVGGWSMEQVRAHLERIAPESRVAPVEPRVDPATQGLIPGLDGVELDVQATLERVLRAPPNASVAYVFREIPPSKTLADLPLAPIYQGNPAKRAVAVEINVAWGKEWIPGLLDVLDRHHAKATWFLMGDWAKANASLARQIAQRGHEIASHGYSAVDWERLDRKGILEQITMADQAIQAATGVRPFWFSTHKGVVNEEILKAARELGHETVMWTADTVDWMNPTVDWMVGRVLKKAGPGALILMHPTERTPDALDRILSALEARGLKVLTVGDLLSTRRLDVPAEQTAPSR